MKADQARVRDLLTQTIALMCRNGLDFSHDLRIEGLLAVTVDGTEIFVIHMDEKVTDRPSYAAGSRCTESITGHQQRDSADAAASDADDISVNHLNDRLFPSTSPAVGDKSESSSAFRTEDVHSVKIEPNDGDSDDDDVMIMESDVRSLMSSTIPLPVVEGMNEYEDGSPYHSPLSPVSKKRKSLHGRISFGGLPTSVESISESDDQLGFGDKSLWTGSASNSNNLCMPLTGESDISHHSSTYDMAPHASFLSASRSQALVSG